MIREPPLPVTSLVRKGTTMKTASLPLLLAVGCSCLAAADGDEIRIFVTESIPVQINAEGSAGEVEGTLAVTGGNSKSNLQVIQNFARLCPQLTITSNRAKADFVVRFDHDDLNPFTGLYRGNRVAVFNADEDLVYSTATRRLVNGVKDTCQAILAMAGDADGSDTVPE